MSDNDNAPYDQDAKTDDPQVSVPDSATDTDDPQKDVPDTKEDIVDGGDPSVDTALLDLHTSLEADDKTPEDMEGLK